MANEERAAYRKLERACHALIISARIHLRAGKKWPTKSIVPNKKLTRVTDLLNALTRMR